MQRTEKALPRPQIEREKCTIRCNPAALLLKYSICVDVSKPVGVCLVCTNSDLTLQNVLFMGILSRDACSVLLYIHSLFDAF